MKYSVGGDFHLELATFDNLVQLSTYFNWWTREIKTVHHKFAHRTSEIEEPGEKGHK